MEAQITATPKGRKWLATGQIPGHSALLAPEGIIVRTAKARDPEVAIDQVEDALVIAQAQDIGAVEVERAEATAASLRDAAESTVEINQAGRVQPNVVTRVVSLPAPAIEAVAVTEIGNEV